MSSYNSSATIMDIDQIDKTVSKIQCCTINNIKCNTDINEIFTDFMLNYKSENSKNLNDINFQFVKKLDIINRNYSNNIKVLLRKKAKYIEISNKNSIAFKNVGD